MKKDNDNNTKEQEDIWVAKKKYSVFFFYLAMAARKLFSLIFCLLACLRALRAALMGSFFRASAWALGSSTFQSHSGYSESALATIGVWFL